MRRRLRSVGSALFSLMAFVILAAAGCTTGTEDVPATAPPTTTGIPMGAPGARGVRFDPPAPTPKPSRRLDGVEQKVNPEPGGGAEPEPAIPPSPFGIPPEEDPPPPPPIKKKPSGGTQL